MDVMNIPDVYLFFFFCLSGFCKADNSASPHLCIFSQGCSVFLCYSDRAGGLICSPWHSSLELTFTAGDYSLPLIRIVTVQNQGLSCSTTKQCNAQTNTHNTLLPTTLPTGSTVVVIKKKPLCSFEQFSFFPYLHQKEINSQNFWAHVSAFPPVALPLRTSSLAVVHYATRVKHS